jgi:hypothetical protein
MDCARIGELVPSSLLSFSSHCASSFCARYAELIILLRNDENDRNPRRTFKMGVASVIASSRLAKAATLASANSSANTTDESEPSSSNDVSDDDDAGYMTSEEHRKSIDVVAAKVSDDLKTLVL